MKRLIFIPLLFLSLLLYGTNYYVSNSGSDTNNGLTVSTSWKTISKVTRSTFLPNDSILFQRGDIWRGGTANVCDYNLVYNSASSLVYSWDNGTAVDLAGMRGFGQELNGINTNPLLTSLYMLQPLSPAINTGYVVSLTRDITGITVTTLPDIGAFERAIRFITKNGLIVRTSTGVPITKTQ